MNVKEIAKGNIFHENVGTQASKCDQTGSNCGGVKRKRGRPRKKVTEVASSRPKMDNALPNVKKNAEEKSYPNGNDDLTGENVIGIIGNESNSQPEYLVENILGRFKNKGVVYYFVKWLGYDSQDNTWEPKENLSSCSDLLAKVDAELAEKEKQRKNKTRNKNLAKKNTCESKIKESCVDIPKRKICQISSTSNKHGEEQKDTHQNATATVTGNDWANQNSQTKDSSSAKPDEDGEKLDGEPGRDNKEEYGPLYRKVWMDSEIPLCVLGSNFQQRRHFLLVRLKPSSDEELSAAKNNPYDGVSVNNCVITYADTFKNQFPQLLIEYYQNCRTKTSSSKTSEETAKAAATAGIFHQHKEQKLEVMGKKIFNDMMGDPLSHTDRPFNLNKRTKYNWENDEKEDSDQFGLPGSCSSSDSEQNDDDEESSESNDDSDNDKPLIE